MFTASSAPVTSRCRPRWSTLFCFRGPLRGGRRMSSCVSSGLVFPVCLRSFWGRAVCVLLSARPALPVPSGPAGPSSPSRRLVAPRAPRLSLRTCRLTPARCSALPRAPPAALLCLPALFFLLPAAGGGVALLPFVPVPLLPFRQPGPRLGLCLSSRLWRLFTSPLFLLPFSLPCPSPLATFSLPLLLSCPLWLGHSYGCFWDIFFFLLFMVRLSHGRGEGEDIE